VAEHLLGTLCYAADYHVFGHMGLMNVNNTDRMSLWIYSMGGQAITRNTPIVMIDAIYCRSGPGTTDLLWEVAAGSVTTAVSGVHQGGVGCTGGSDTDVYTGLEARFNAKVSHAALGLSRSEANDYVLQFLNRYEDKLANPDRGRTFPDLYDVDTVEPGQEWLGMVQQVTDEIGSMGLDVENAWKAVLQRS